MAVYQELQASEWRRKIEALKDIKARCTFCARKCQVNRMQNGKGFCNAPAQAKISSFHRHFGEEQIISGTKGSGTVFFAHCNLRCKFCQNFEISVFSAGELYSAEELAAVFLTLQRQQAHNLNLVTPTPYLLEIVEALEIAAARGFNLPLIFNCGGYENPEVLKILHGLIDIYLPDFKFGRSSFSRELAAQLAQAPDYGIVAEKAIAEMFRQTGSPLLSADNIIQKGTVIRHLILPGVLKNSFDVIDCWQKSTFRQAPLSLLRQFHPAFQSYNFPYLRNTLSEDEYRQVVDFLKEHQVSNIILQ